jgi:hypothetical protein
LTAAFIFLFSEMEHSSFMMSCTMTGILADLKENSKEGFNELGGYL